ncbi:MAG: hypothetical protein K2X27_18135 [Candidatus Obscuribacterales bacterium]|nr:hypothetical protein [Candidatus Obscuribacterales bacterium]
MADQQLALGREISLSMADFETLFGRGYYRGKLMSAFREAISSLRSAGCKRISVGYSFISPSVDARMMHVGWDAKGVDRSLLSAEVLDNFVPGDLDKYRSFGCHLFPSDQNFDGVDGMTYLRHNRLRNQASAVVLIELA